MWIYIDGKIIGMLAVTCIFIFLILMYIKTSNKETIAVAVLTIIFTTTLSIVSIFEKPIYFDKNEKEFLYSSIYFRSMRHAILTVGILNATDSIKSDTSNKSIEFLADHYAQNIPVPYDVLNTILSDYKTINCFPEIPYEYLVKLNTFMDGKIAFDKDRLQQKNSSPYIRQVFYDVVMVFKEYLDIIFKNDAVSNLPKIFSKMNNELTGLLTNRSKEIFSDYRNTVIFIDNCEKEYWGTLQK